MKKKRSKTRTKKFRTMILSVLFAIVVWFAVIYVNDPDITTAISDLDVRIVGEAMLKDKNLAVTGRSEIPPLSVVVTGKRSDLINFMDEVYVQVDVSGINEEGEYKLEGSISLPTTRISVERENFSEVPLTAEKIQSKEIEISLKQTGTLKNKIVKSEISNPKITITGAESEINNVYGGTAVIDVADLKSDKLDRINYVLTDEEGNPIGLNETIESVRSFVEVESIIYEAKTLPVEAALTAELQQNYILKTDKTTIAPSVVTVGVDGSNTDEKVIARIDKLYESGSGEYSLEASSGMYIPPEQQFVKIKTETSKKAAAELTLNIETENVPEGLRARVQEPITAHIWGEEGNVNNDNVRAVVDLSGLTAGEYILPVKLIGDNVSFMGEYKATVIIE